MPKAKNFRLAHGDAGPALTRKRFMIPKPAKWRTREFTFLSPAKEQAKNPTRNRKHRIPEYIKALIDEAPGDGNLIMRWKKSIKTPFPRKEQMSITSLMPISAKPCNTRCDRIWTCDLSFGHFVTCGRRSTKARKLRQVLLVCVPERCFRSARDQRYNSFKLTKKKRTPYGIRFFLVDATGFEPATSASQLESGNPHSYFISGHANRNPTTSPTTWKHFSVEETLINKEEVYRLCQACKNRPDFFNFPLVNFRKATAEPNKGYFSAKSQATALVFSAVFFA